MTTLEKTTVRLKLQGAPVEVSRDLWRLWLEPGQPESGVEIRKEIDPKKPIAWKELDQLPELTELVYQGTDPKVVGYLAKRPKIRTFRWSDHGQKSIDLSKTHLTELGLETRGALDLVLPRSLTTLRWTNSRALSKVKITTDDAGARLELYVWAPRGPVPFAPGLAELREIWITGGEVDSLAFLAKYRALRSIRLGEAYHTDFSTLPAPLKLPALERLEIDGLRDTAAKLVRERYAGFKGLRLCGVRSDAWLRKNADNPFRNWPDEYDATICARATKAYRAAQTAIEGVKRSSPKETEKILRAFVDAFNAIESDIDTIMREEIDTAFHGLASQLGVPSKRASAMIDGWRDF